MKTESTALRFTFLKGYDILGDFMDSYPDEFFAEWNSER